mgnify:CR=1 FL=1
MTESRISIEDRKKIEAGIQEKYSKVAKSPEDQFKYPTGREGLRKLQYDLSIIDQLPDDVASLYCGVGNPFSLGKIHSGEQILDIGCGAGVDAIIAAILTGPNGEAFGVDIVPEMIQQAKSNRDKTGLENVHFRETSGEALPFGDEVFDAVISNGAINLMPDKEKALSEAFRVMKLGGRLMIADQVSSANVQKDIKSRVDSWFQ